MNLPDRRLSVLVVDDDPRTLSLHASIVDALGYRVLAAQDGLEAMAVLDLHQVDVIVTDLCMPGMGGLELAKAIRQRGGEMPYVVIVSSTPEAIPSDAQAMFSIRGVIEKPADRDALAKHLDAALRER